MPPLTVTCRSVGTRMRPTWSSRASILTLRASFSRTWSSLLLATRRTKNCMACRSEGRRVEHADEVEEVAEEQVENEEDGGDEEHEDDHDAGGAEQLLAAGPVDLLHLALGGDQEIDHHGLVEIV